MQNIYSINRTKAEAPAIATFAIIGFIGSIAFYPYFKWGAFLLFPLLAIIFLILRHFRVSYFNRQCFLLIDDDGIKYSFTVYQRPVFIAWNQIERINYQLYEINIRIKNTGEVISLQIGYLKHPEEFDEIREILDAKTVQV